MDREIKAYVIITFCNIFVVFYLLWTLLPSRVLHSFGITYYPSKHWALCVPSLCLFFIPSMFFYTWFTEGAMLSPMNRKGCFMDERAKGFGKGVDCGKQLLYDIPIEEANRLLYGAND